MITFMIKLLILIYFVYMIFHVKSMIQYNPNANVIYIEQADKDKIRLELNEKSPLVIKHHLDYSVSFNSMNLQIPGYIINDNETLLSLDQLCKSESVNVYHNSKLVEDFNLSETIKLTEDLMTTSLKCSSDYGLSLYKGHHESLLFKNYRETSFIQPLYGDIVLYIFNPKHEKDIKGKQFKSIKKWGIRLELTKDTLVVIPTEWFYFYEIDKETILMHGSCDTYFSWLFNYIRKK